MNGPRWGSGMSPEGADQFGSMLKRQGSTSGGANFEGARPRPAGPGGWNPNPGGGGGLKSGTLAPPQRLPMGPSNMFAGGPRGQAGGGVFPNPHGAPGFNDGIPAPTENNGPQGGGPMPIPTGPKQGGGMIPADTGFGPGEFQGMPRILGGGDLRQPNWYGTPEPVGDPTKAFSPMAPKNYAGMFNPQPQPLAATAWPSKWKGYDANPYDPDPVYQDTGGFGMGESQGMPIPDGASGSGRPNGWRWGIR